jgi:hypothetical protein
MGHTSRFEAAAAAATAWPPAPSRTFVPMSSLLDVWELRETELAEGESRLALRAWAWAWAWAWGEGDGDEGRAGERWRELPRIRPPPRDLREVMDMDIEGEMGVVDERPASCPLRPPGNTGKGTGQGRTGQVQAPVPSR